MNDRAVDMNKVKRLLQSHRVFASLNGEELQLLCDVSSIENFAVGTDLIKEEKPNHFLYLILEGEVFIKSYGKKIDERFVGSLMGVISAAGLGSLTEDCATVEVVAATAVQAASFPVDAIHKIAGQNKKFSEALYDVAMTRLLK